MDLEVMATKLSGDPEQDIKTLSNHVFQLEENLRYMLRNLDVTNFNDLGLARYENGRLQVYAKEVALQTEKLRVEFGKETDDIYAAISATAEELLAEIESVDGSYSKLSQTVSGIQTTVSGQAKTISSHANSINSLQSQITQTANEIAAVVSAVDDSSGYVTAASIVAAINKTSGSSMVKIEADHIEMTGTTTFVSASDLSTYGRTVINAGNIQTGTISADFISGGVLSGVRVESIGGTAPDDPRGPEQVIAIEDGVLDIAGTRFYNKLYGFEMNCGRNAFSIILYGGTEFYFAPEGIYKDGVKIA